MKSSIVSTLEWCGSVTGCIGALLLSLNSDVSKFGYLAFATSNSAWLIFALLIKRPSIFVMNVAFSITTAIGISCWFS